MREITTRRLKEVKAWIKSVYEKDGYKCQTCGVTENLQAHHIISWDDAPDLRVDINNGLTLCRSCHKRHHASLKKRTRESIDKWRESRKGYRHSKETIEKLKKNAGRPKGIPMSLEQKELYKKIFTGRKTSEATKEKQRKNAGRPKSKQSNQERKNRAEYYAIRELVLDSETGKKKWVLK